MPEELVLAGIEEDRHFQETFWQGRRFLTEDAGRGRRRIVRLLSSDPADYLRPEYAPGSLIGSFCGEKI